MQSDDSREGDGVQRDDAREGDGVQRHDMREDESVEWADARERVYRGMIRGKVKLVTGPV